MASEAPEQQAAPTSPAAVAVPMSENSTPGTTAKTVEGIVALNAGTTNGALVPSNGSSEEENNKAATLATATSLSLVDAASAAVIAKRGKMERANSISSSHDEDDGEDAEEDDDDDDEPPAPDDEAGNTGGDAAAMTSNTKQGDDNNPPLRPKQWLPKDFQPHPNDVLCGRGKTYREWPGNEQFRVIVETHLEEYKASVGRSEKGLILTRVVEAVRTQEGATGFLKQGGAGRWYEVGDFYAREKTSQLFRDCLHEHYSSSNMTKKKKRQEERMVMERMKRRRIGEKVEKAKGPSAASHGTSLVSAATLPSFAAMNLPGGLAAKTASFPFFTNPATAAAAAALNASKQRIAFTAALAAKAGLAASVFRAPESLDPASRPIGSTQQSPVKKDKSLERDVASVLQQLAGVSGSNQVLSSSATNSLLAQVAESSPAAAGMPTGVNPTVTATSAAAAKPLFRSIPSPAELTVCALQPHLRGPEDSPLDATTRILDTIEKISSRKLIDLFVLPEMCPVGYSEDTFARFLPKTSLMKDMYFLIDEAFAMRAQRLNVFICYGTIGWQDDADGHEVYTIRHKVVDRAGKVAAVYDQMFLRDYEEYAESRYFVPGAPTPVSFQVDQFRLGLVVGSDLRYSHLARALARDHQVDALLQPAAATRDRSFRTWKSFCESRAVESSVYVIAVNYAGDKYGHTSITPPWLDDDHETDQLGPEDGFLVGKVERSMLDLVRTTMPFHRQLSVDVK